MDLYLSDLWTVLANFEELNRDKGINADNEMGEK